MKRWWALLAICITCTFAGGAIYLSRAQQLAGKSNATTPATSPEEERYIARLAAFDPVAYAKAAIRARDYRYVKPIGESEYESPFGIRCLAIHQSARYIGFVHGVAISEHSDKVLVAAARVFNQALVSDPSYPDKDVCLPRTEGQTRQDAIRLAGEFSRRPQATNLHTAARAQDLAAVARFIAAGSDLNAVDAWGRTPLKWAAHRKNIAIATKLIAAGAKFDILDDPHKSALKIATETGDATFLRKFLAEIRRLGIPPRHRGDALDAAVSLKRVDLIDLLFQYGEAPLPDDAGGWLAPLRTALRRDCVACIDILIANGKPNARRGSPIHQLITEEFASESNALLPLINIALDGIANSASAKKVLAVALKRNDLELIRKLLAETQDVNLLRTDELVGLLSAVESGDECRRDIALTFAKRRRQELDAAIRANDLKQIGQIVTDGATLDQDFAFTPLMQAAVASNGATIETLLTLGAKLDAHVDALHSRFASITGESFADDGPQALYYAIKHLNTDAARTLLRKGADLDAKDGAWPMLTSVGRLWEDKPLVQQEHLVDLLLAHKQRQKHADQMLASAASWGRRGLIDILITRGARSCGDIDYSSQAIESVAGLGDLELLKRFISLCPTWSPTAAIAQATLKEAIFGPAAVVQKDVAGRIEVVRYLLEQGIPLATPEYGETALKHAVMERNIKLAELLLIHGVDINEISQYRTALDAADGDAQMTNLLRANGARTAKELGVNTEQPFPF